MSCLRLVIALFALWSSPALHADGPFSCDRLLSDLRAPYFTKQETVKDRDLSVTELLWPPILRRERADLIKSNVLKQDFWGELFQKIVKPAMTGQWFVNRYSVLDLVELSDRNKVILALDTNHAYLMLYDGQAKTVTRVDGGAHKKVFVRKDMPVITEGLFFDFPDLSEDDFAAIKERVQAGDVYETCAHAACDILKAGGISTGPDTTPIPRTTSEFLQVALRDGFYKDGVPLETLVVKTNGKPLAQLVSDAEKVSRANGELRNREMHGFLIVAKYASRTLAHWFFFGSPGIAASK